MKLPIKLLKILKDKLKIARYNKIKSHNKSDKKRWSNKESLFENWDERTKLLANFVQPKTSVLEFGSARLVLPSFLPEGCIYYNSDLVKRNENTLVIDLNVEPLPELPFVDYVIFSGVLEYINHIDKVIAHTAAYTNNFLFSYATLNKYSSLDNRRINGWVSDYSLEELEKIFIDNDFTFTVIGEWNKQTLFHCIKKH